MLEYIQRLDFNDLIVATRILIMESIELDAK